MGPITGRMLNLGTSKPDLYIRRQLVVFLNEFRERTTQMIARARIDWKADALISIGVRLVLEPAHFLMERRMLSGVNQRAEQASQGAGDQLNSKAKG
jgi:hypothetical protein